MNPRSGSGAASAQPYPPTVQLVYDRIDSTHRQGVDQVRQGVLAPPADLWVWMRAQWQSCGVGQFGRPFVSGRGGMYASLVCRWPGPVLPALTTLALALALKDALYDLWAQQGLWPPCQQGPPEGFVQEPGVAKQENLRLKWPNDLYWVPTKEDQNAGGVKKLAGVLAQGVHGRDGQLYGVLSAGLNVNQSPFWINFDRLSFQRLPDQAASVQAVTGRGADLAQVFDLFAGHLWPSLVMMLGRPDQLIQKACQSLQGWGQSVTAQTSQGLIRGLFQRLDQDGRLWIDGRPYLVDRLMGVLDF